MKSLRLPAPHGLSRNEIPCPCACHGVQFRRFSAGVMILMRLSACCIDAEPSPLHRIALAAVFTRVRTEACRTDDHISQLGRRKRGRSRPSMLPDPGLPAHGAAFARRPGSEVEAGAVRSSAEGLEDVRTPPLRPVRRSRGPRGRADRTERWSLEQAADHATGDPRGAAQPGSDLDGAGVAAVRRSIGTAGNVILDPGTANVSPTCSSWHFDSSCRSVRCPANDAIGLRAP